MNKYNNPRLTNTTIAGSGMKHPVRPHVIIGDPSNGYLLGDLMDANAVKEITKEIVNDAPEALDTLKELADALNDDSNFATTIINRINAVDTTYRDIPAGWDVDHSMSQLIASINNDTTAVPGKSYLGTVHLSDLPENMMQAELIIEVMDQLGSDGNKVIKFELSSSDVAPYKWEYTSAYGALGAWRSWVIEQQQADWNLSDSTAIDYIKNKPTVTDSKLVTTTSVSDNTTYYPIVGANNSSASTKNIDSTGYKYNSVSGTTSDAGYSTVTLGNGTASGTAGSKRGQLALYDNGTHSNTLNSALLTANRVLSLPDEDGTLATQAYVATNGGSIDVIQVDGVPLTIGANKTVNIELNDRLSAYDSITIETPVNSSDATAPITTLNCAFGRYYRVDVPVEALAINLPEITDNTTVRTFVVFLKWGTTPAITITPDDSEPIYYLEGYEELILTMVSGDILELNFLWNGGAWIIAGIRILEPTV